MARRITLLEQWTAIVRNFSDHFSVVFSILYINTYEISLTLARDQRYFCEINEMSSRMPTYKEPQILDKVCKDTRQKQIKYYDFILFFDFQYEKNTFNCQPSHISPCYAVPVTGVKWENDGFWSSGFFRVFFPLCFVKSGIKWRELDRNQTIKNGGGSCALFSLAPFPIVFSFGLGSAVLSSKTRLKTHQKTPVSKASQNAYWRPKILTICTHVRSSRQNEATCADRTFSR